MGVYLARSETMSHVCVVSVVVCGSVFIANASSLFMV